jgi:hypothetical protein
MSGYEGVGWESPNLESVVVVVDDDDEVLQQILII